MTADRNDIGTLRARATEELAQVTAASELEKWRIKFLGRKGAIPQLLRHVRTLPVEERKQIGQEGNQLRQEIERYYQAKWEELQLTLGPSAERSRAPAKGGHLHPLTLTIRRLQEIFTELGFLLVEGPLVEETKYNFDLINIPPDHPARAESDSFYLTTGQVLRTQVTPCQIRGPLENNLRPPFKIFYYGPTFRAEKVDATHEATFHQYEFMVVDKTASLADLKGVITHIYSEYFARKIHIRFRPGFFPFVEPGLEIDANCLFCAGRGCRICKHTGWIEMAGAGAVHPNVLANINVNPDQYQGFALGGGMDRLAMLKYGIDDIRKLRAGDLKFIANPKHSL